MSYLQCLQYCPLSKSMFVSVIELIPANIKVSGSSKAAQIMKILAITQSEFSYLTSVYYNYIE